MAHPVVSPAAVSWLAANVRILMKSQQEKKKMFVTAEQLVGEHSIVANAKTGVDDKTILDTNIIDKQLAFFDDWKEEMEEWKIVINEATARFANEVAIIHQWSSNIDDLRNLINNLSNAIVG